MKTIFQGLLGIVILALGVYLIEPAQSDKILAFIGSFLWGTGLIMFYEALNNVHEP